MKYLFLALLAFCLAVPGCGSSSVKVVSARSGADLAAQTSAYTVALVKLRISLFAGAELKPYCAGVWISHDRILTAAHCTKSVQQVDGVFVADLMASYSKKSLDEAEIGAVRILKRDNDKDLALLQALDPPRKHTFAKLRSGLILQGEPCFVVGHPVFLPWTYTSGVISAFYDIQGQTYIETDATVFFGNSGGGMFDDLGNLEGIASMLDGSEKYAFFVHRDNIESFLK